MKEGSPEWIVHQKVIYLCNVLGIDREALHYDTAAMLDAAITKVSHRV